MTIKDILIRLLADVDDSMEFQGTALKPNSYAERDVEAHLNKAAQQLEGLMLEDVKNSRARTHTLPNPTNKKGK